MKAPREIVFHRPQVRGNRVLFSWDPLPGFRRNGCEVRYPDLTRVAASTGKLTEAYLPMVLAAAAWGDVRVRLPYRLPDAILERWAELARALGERLFKQPGQVRFEGDPPGGTYAQAGAETGLFYGGGTESLLTLAHLRGEGVRPILISLGGPNWPGSDPERNPDKFELDRRISEELDLKLLSVWTNFKDAFDPAAWSRWLKPGISLINAVIALPGFIAAVLPVAEQSGLGRLVNGNERMNFPDEYLCFSPLATERLRWISWGVRYESRLGDFLKEDVCHSLYRDHPELARFQYSCWRNDGRRWCYRCQSCLEYFMLLKNSRLPVEAVGMKEPLIRANLKRLIWEVALSPEARPGEIWQRLRLYPRLREDPFLRGILDAIALRARISPVIAAGAKLLPRLLKRGIKAALKPALAPEAAKIETAPEKGRRKAAVAEEARA